MSEGRLFQTKGPTIEKVLFCLVALRASGTTKSHQEADLGDRLPAEQAEVGIKSSRRCAGAFPRTQCKQGVICRGCWGDSTHSFVLFDTVLVHYK